MTIEQSNEYQTALQAKQIQNDLYSTKKKELENLLESKTQTISAMEKTRDSWGRNYITMKENAQSSINKKISEFDTTINQKSAELSELSNKLAAPIKVENQTLSTIGYSAIFNTLADFLNKNDNSSKKNPYKSETIELWFYLLLGVGVEALANMFAYLAQKNTYFNSKPEPKNLETCESTRHSIPSISSAKKFRINKSAFIAKKSGNIIGFKPEPKIANNDPVFDIDEKDFDKYIKYMYDKQRNGYAPGYLDIARNINIAVEKARAIKGELNRRGMIKTVGNRTVIVK
jgi:hypothetical protein